MKLTFPPELVTAPLIYNLVQDYRITTNIHRADIAGEQGWVVLEMEGSDEDIEKGLACITAKGVEVEAIDSEP
jgi:ABC-type methionine transport system ATPase subunit